MALAKPSPKGSTWRVSTKSTMDLIIDTQDKDDISLRNQIESPFLRLPAEIRNLVYEYALGGLYIDAYHLDPEIDFDPIVMRTHYGHAPGAYRLQLPEQKTNLFAPPKTCRQIHSEAGLLFYKLNEFGDKDLEWNVPGRLLELFDGFIQRQLLAITCVYLPIRGWVALSQLPDVTEHKPIQHGIEKLNGLQKVIATTDEYRDNQTRHQEWAVVTQAIEKVTARKDLEILYEELGAVWEQGVMQIHGVVRALRSKEGILHEVAPFKMSDP